MFSNRILANPPTMEPASYFTHPTRLVLSFEFFLAALMVIGGLKKNPTFAWMFPVDGTAMVFTVVACLLTLHMLKNGIPRYALQAIIYYILFCLWTVASASWSLVDSLQSLPDFIVRILLVNGIMLVGTLVVVTRDPERTVRFMAALTFFGLLMGINYVAQVGSFSSSIVPEDTQYNIVGSAVANSFIILFGFMVYSPIMRSKWIFYAVCLVILFYAAMMIGSRQNVVAMVGASIIVMSFLVNFRKAQLRIHIGLLPAIVLGFAVVLAVAFLIQIGTESRTISRLSKLLGYLQGSQTDQSAATRLHYLGLSVEYWTDSVKSVLFGDGIFSFSFQVRGAYFEGTHPHDIVMYILAEFGLIGLILYTMVLVCLALNTGRISASSSPIKPIIFSLISASMFKGIVSGTVGSSYMILVTMALLASLRVLPRTGLGLRRSPAQFSNNSPLHDELVH